MSSGLLAFFAFAPILLAGILLIGLRWPAVRAMPIVFLVTAAIGYAAWDMTFNRIVASSLRRPTVKPPGGTWRSNCADSTRPIRCCGE